MQWRAVPTISTRVIPALFLTIVAEVGFCADAPTKMIHAIVQISGTDIPDDSFFHRPKAFWRASKRYCRLDEERDAARSVRLVVNEPDAWLIELPNNSAKHMLDKVPPFHCRLPIFTLDQETTDSKIGELEVGRERDFFQTNGAKMIDGPKLPFRTNYYELQFGDSTLTLVERVDTHTPIAVRLARKGKTYTARYLLWDEVPFEEDLFTIPTGVRIEEVK